MEQPFDGSIDPPVHQPIDQPTMATDNDKDNGPSTGGPTTTNDNDNGNDNANDDDDEPEPTQAESEMTESIAKDRPTIDAAVKSFVGMVCARSMASSNTDKAKTTGSTPSATLPSSASIIEQQQDKVMMGIIPGLAQTSISAAQSPATATKNKAAAKDSNSNGSGSATTKSSTGTTTTSSTTQERVLQLARLVLKTINSHTFPVHDTVAYSMAEKPGTSPPKKAELLEISVVARLWNALVESDQKPSRFLGRRALRLAWKKMDVGASLRPQEKGNGVGDNDNNDNDNDNDREQQLEWLQQFEVLLFESCKPLPSDIKVDDDSALLWAPDGGASELAKRRQRRLAAAKERGPSTPS